MNRPDYAQLADLPRLDDVPAPPEGLLRSGRPVAQRLLRARYDIRVHGADLMPDSGPVIVASNHVGLIDGPLMAIFSPRPVHALTKEEMFDGPLGVLLRSAGQISLDRVHADPGAIKACLRLLADGRCVGVFPEGTRGDGELHRFHGGTAYLALATGAPVLPLAGFGTRPPDGGSNALPARGERIDLVFGEPITMDRMPWPRRREQVRGASALLHEKMLAHLAHAKELTGRELPGPIVAPADGATTNPTPEASNKEKLDD